MYLADTSRWYLERIVWLVAGTVVLTGTLLGIIIHPYWFALPILAGTNMLIFSLTGFCPMAVILHKLGIKSISELNGRAPEKSGTCMAH